MTRATIAFVLHAHLPWVDPELEDDTLESRWLLDAITDCYLPLLARLGALAADGIPASLTLSVSPTLLAQLAHPTLPRRYARHLDRLDRLLGTEWDAAGGTPLLRVLDWHRARLARARTRFFDEHHGDLPASLGALRATGCVELATTAATHAVLPLFASQPDWVGLQVATGLATFRRHVGGEAPAGFWLPECAWDPALDAVLQPAGVRHVVVDTHALSLGNPAPVYGPYAPVASPTGIIAFAREPEGTAQVWDATRGYPGDPWYLDRHADVGWTLPPDRLRDTLPVPPGGGPIGLRYARVTGTPAKALYEPERAAERVAAQARDFVDQAALRALELGRTMDRPPVLTYAFDAELFGHWWFEGPDWLDAVLRRLARHDVLTARTLTEDLAAHPTIQRVAPAASTWGAGGHLGVWVDERTAPSLAEIHRLGAALGDLARAPSTAGPSGSVLGAAIRHLLLAQSSDWAFMITRDTGAPYGWRRLRGHIDACRRLCRAVERGVPPDRSDLGGEWPFPAPDPRALAHPNLLSQPRTFP